MRRSVKKDPNKFGKYFTYFMPLSLEGYSNIYSLV